MNDGCPRQRHKAVWTTWRARERAWYCIRGLLPKSPSTTTAALRLLFLFRLPKTWRIPHYQNHTEKIQFWLRFASIRTSWQATPYIKDYQTKAWNVKKPMTSSSSCRLFKDSQAYYVIGGKKQMRLKYIKVFYAFLVTLFAWIFCSHKPTSPHTIKPKP